jgi:hypothetical protein
MVPFGENGDAAKAYFSKAVCPQATTYPMMVK